MRIKYIGKAPEHGDRFYGTGVTWQGEGDVQPVSDEVAARQMLDNHPDIYAEVVPLAEGERPAAPAQQVEPSAVDELVVEEMDGSRVRAVDATRAALARYAESKLGIMVMPDETKADILSDIGTVESAYDEFRRAVGGVRGQVVADKEAALGIGAAPADDIPPNGEAPTEQPAPPAPDAEAEEQPPTGQPEAPAETGTGTPPADDPPADEAPEQTGGETQPPADDSGAGAGDEGTGEPTGGDEPPADEAPAETEQPAPPASGSGLPSVEELARGA